VKKRLTAVYNTHALCFYLLHRPSSSNILDFALCNRSPSRRLVNSESVAISL